MSKYQNDEPIIIKQYIFSDDGPERLELIKEVEEEYFIRFHSASGTCYNGRKTFNNLKDASVVYYNILNL